jgi:predicted nucleic acid-binding protein
VILYCDSSALVKLYINEGNSDQVRAKLAIADLVAVCRIAWVEVQAAFARRARESPVDADLIEQAKAAFRADWPRFVVMEITQHLVERAGDYADAFALRAFDSLQLATATEAAEIIEPDLIFACFDHRLNKAAATLGLSCL